MCFQIGVSLQTQAAATKAQTICKASQSFPAKETKRECQWDITGRMCFDICFQASPGDLIQALVFKQCTDYSVLDRVSLVIKPSTVWGLTYTLAAFVSKRIKYFHSNKNGENCV